MKISRNVGAGVHGALPADVKLVQQALAAIKPLGSPSGHYNGSVDGICGPLTISAINSFQSDNHISATGRIEPTSQTMRVMTEKTPKALQFMLERSGGGSAGSVGSVGAQNLGKVRMHNKAVAEHAESVWTLPSKEGAALGKAIRRVAAEDMVPLMFDIPDHVTLDGDGRFVVELRVAVWGHGSGADGLAEAKIMAEAATQTIIKSEHWQRVDASALRVKSRDAYPWLAGGAAPSEPFLDEIILRQNDFKNPTHAAIAASLEILTKQGA